MSRNNEVAKHTPGPPWDFIEGKTLIHIETPFDHPEGAGIPICSVPKSKKNLARLIAAAPELLEALKVAMSFLDYVDGRNVATQKQINVFNTLIAKAEGAS